MLPYLVVRARWTAFALLVACSFDGSGLVSAGPPSSTTTSTTGDTTTTTDPGTTVTPTTVGPGTDSGGETTSTTTPVDPTDATTTTTTTTTPGTTDVTTTTTGPDTTTSTGPDTTDTSSTTSTDTSTSTGPDTTTGQMCVDTGMEPNEDEPNAIDLGNQHCKADPKTFSGVLDGDGDVDWFRFHGDFDGNGCGNIDPDPTASIKLTAAGPLEVCFYADCDPQGETDFNCPNGTSDADSPGGREGCCGTGDISYIVNCVNGGDESAMMYVRLQKAPVDACLEYSVEYSYHN